MSRKIEYPTENPNLKLVCPYCGHTKFFYREARVFDVHIDNISISTYTDETGVQTDTVARLELGRDYRGQGSGDVDELIDYGALYCRRCRQEVGDNNTLRPMYVLLSDDCYYDKTKGYPRKRNFPEKQTYINKCTGQQSKQ